MTYFSWFSKPLEKVLLIKDGDVHGCSSLGVIIKQETTSADTCMQLLEAKKDSAAEPSAGLNEQRPLNSTASYNLLNKPRLVYSSVGFNIVAQCRLLFYYYSKVQVFTDFSDLFWSKSFWLPSYSNWDDLEKRTPERFYPNARDLWFPIPLAVVLFLIRLIWERCVATPIGRSFNLKELPPRPAKPNQFLEGEFKKHRKVLPSNLLVEGYAKHLDWTVRDVQRWWRMRRAQCKPSELQRFKETSWRFLFYLCSFWGGIYTLWDKPWFKDTKYCWYSYPMQHVSSDVYWYYMLELSFYWSLVLSLFMDTRRKDFKEMIIHHISTITLMTMSYSANMIRVGTLVLCVHDAVDYIMEFGKLAKYCKYDRVSDTAFILFAVMWLITRLTIYPFWILRSTLFEATTIVGMAPIYYMYNGLLCVLQVLHVFWFYIILRMAYSYIIKGKVEKDARSDTEESEDDTTNTENSTNHGSRYKSNIAVQDKTANHGKRNNSSSDKTTNQLHNHNNSNSKTNKSSKLHHHDHEL